MTLLAVDWATIASLATAVGTLVLAIATFVAVRSSNRSARIAEIALQEQRRPLLAPSRLQDPNQKIMFLEGHWVSAAGGRAVVEHLDGVVYLAISLRNVGSGIAVCQGWVVRPEPASTTNIATHAPARRVPAAVARPLHTGRRHRHVAGRAAPPRRPCARRGRR